MKAAGSRIGMILSVVVGLTMVTERNFGLTPLGGMDEPLKPVPGQAKRSDAVVKVSSQAEPPDAQGRRVVSIRLAIDPGWYIYGNPVGNSELEGSETVVSLVGGRGKLREVQYPKGQLRKEKLLDNEVEYQIYEGTVTIRAIVEAPPDGTIELAVKFGACSQRGSCLQPATVKLTVK